MSTGLDSARRKWLHAAEHLHVIKTEAGAFTDSNPIALVPERNSDRTQEWWKVVQLKPVPDTIATRVGDAIHNLRSSLDHLVYALGHQRGAVPHTGSAFPLCGNRAKFIERSKNPKRAARPYSPTSGMAKITGLRPAAQAFIERYQPYNGTDVGGKLGLIGKLDNSDKHRDLPLVFMRPASWSHSTPAGTEIEILTYSLIPGTAFAHVTYDEGCTDMSVNLDVTPAIGFPRVWVPIEVTELLAQLWWAVEEVLWEARPLFGLPKPDPIDDWTARDAHHATPPGIPLPG